MKTRIAAVNFFMVVVLSCAYLHGAPAHAQAQGAPDYSPPDPELEVESLDRLKHKSVDNRRGIDRLQAMKASSKLVDALQLPCELTDAIPAGDGTAHINGNAIDIDSYEVACSNGMGYILISQGQKQPTFMSCFAAAAPSDSANAGSGRRKKKELTCRLPVNDTNVMATTMLTGLSAKCTVGGISTFGVNATNHTEYVEVACTGNIGYVLVIPQKADATTQIAVMSCQDAARHSLRCQLTSSNSGPAAPAPVTMQTLYDALKQNGVSCKSQLQLRMIGREAAKRRYVVEARCPEQPSGMVAYIPLEDNTNKYETIDCNEALKRQITCQFTAK